MCQRVPDYRYIVLQLVLLLHSRTKLKQYFLWKLSLKSMLESQFNWIEKWALVYLWCTQICCYWITLLGYKIFTYVFILKEPLIVVTRKQCVKITQCAQRCLTLMSLLHGHILSILSFPSTFKTCGKLSSLYAYWYTAPYIFYGLTKSN